MFDELNDEWILGWKNIISEDYVGDSHGYACDQTAVGTTNGAGGRNVQLFMLAPDGTVLHVLPGFWHPDDLARELDFAQELYRLYTDPGLPRWAKDQAFTARQRAHAVDHHEDTRRRSSWQGFDAKNELERLEQVGFRDTFVLDAEGRPAMNAKGKHQLKTLDVLMHDRMAQRPFMPFEQFDTAVYADYGRRYYDNNKKVDGEGETFMTPARVAKALRPFQRDLSRADKRLARAQQELERAEQQAAQRVARAQERLERAQREREEAAQALERAERGHEVVRN